jgi:hypothetical protein
LLYVSPSQLIEVRRGSNRRARVLAMAEVMAERVAGCGACTLFDLGAAGFTRAEALALADEARAVLAGRALTPSPTAQAKKEADALVKKARRIRRRAKRVAR